MKKINLLVFLLVLSANVFAQDVMDDLANATCECFRGHSDLEDTEELKVKLGLCMLEAAVPFKKQLKKEYKIDLDKLDKEVGEKLGRLVGMRLASKCPDMVMKLVPAETKKQMEANKSPEKSVTGTIAKVDKDFLVCFSVKDDAGKIIKLFWLGNFETELDVVNDYANFVGKKVKLTYRNQEYFDPKIDEYRPMFVITKLEAAE